MGVHLTRQTYDNCAQCQQPLVVAGNGNQNANNDPNAVVAQIVGSRLVHPQCVAAALGANRAAFLWNCAYGVGHAAYLVALIASGTLFRLYSPYLLGSVIWSSFLIWLLLGFLQQPNSAIISLNMAHTWSMGAIAMKSFGIPPEIVIPAAVFLFYAHKKYLIHVSQRLTQPTHQQA